MREEVIAAPGRSGRWPAPAAASVRDRLAASLATVPTGIEPVVLVLLTQQAGLPPLLHGWVVAAGQAAMALGSLLAWRLPALGRRPALAGMALLGVAAVLWLSAAGATSAIIAARSLVGLSAGIIYTRATAAAARAQAHQAFGTIFLWQLGLSALVTAALPWIAVHRGPGFALASLALLPAGTLALLLRGARPDPGGTVKADVREEAPLTEPALPLGHLLAMTLFITVTMMIWSYAGAIADGLRLGAGALGAAVAIGSLLGIPPAVAASYRPARLHPAVTAALCALLTATPLIGWAAGAGEAGYGVAIALFNLGSTYAIIRFSGLAVPAGASGRQRRLVAALHCVGMAAGPALGAALAWGGGLTALSAIAAVLLLCTVIAAARDPLSRT